VTGILASAEIGKAWHENQNSCTAGKIFGGRETRMETGSRGLRNEKLAHSTRSQNGAPFFGSKRETKSRNEIVEAKIIVGGTDRTEKKKQNGSAAKTDLSTRDLTGKTSGAIVRQIRRTKSEPGQQQRQSQKMNRSMRKMARTEQENRSRS
jgi:hypothetical protein